MTLSLTLFTIRNGSPGQTRINLCLRPWSDAPETELSTPEGFLRSYDDVLHLRDTLTEAYVDAETAGYILQLAEAADRTPSTVQRSGDRQLYLKPNQIRLLGFPLLARYDELIRPA